MSAAGTAAAPARRKPRAALKAALWDYAHLAVLSTFALAQPLFELLRDNPEFFAARGAPGFDIVSFAVLVVVLPPAILLVLELLGGLAHPVVRRALHLTFVAALVALIAAQALKKSIDGSDTLLIVLSVVVGVAAAVAYARAEVVHSFVSVLSPAPVVFLAVFLFFSPVSKLAFPSEASARSVGGVSTAPIVVILLDELPTMSLMDDRGHVDAARFPAFARLERSSTWFRNAYAVYDSTERAQPAIFDGNYPSKEKLPTSSDHPNSVFTLFGKTHRMNVSEEATDVCPRGLCEDERLEESYGSRMEAMSEDLGLVWLHVVSPPGMEADLPSVSENWGNFGGGDGEEEADAGDDADADAGQNVRANLNRNRSRRFRAWTDRIEETRKPGLHFKHTLLPHVPWQYLPSGARYRTVPNDVIGGLSTQAYGDEGQRDSLYQRHLLQTGFTDMLLGEVWRRLEQEGMWDDALIVVAADHGVALNVARRDRRRLRRDTAGEIASIPLFIKAPGQKRGKVDDAYVETVDILPTVLDLLDVDPKVRMDGRSAFSRKVQRRDTLRMLERGSFEPIRMSPAEFQRQRGEVLERKLHLFGTGREGRERLYRIGPHQELLGGRLSQLDPAPQGEVSLELEEADEYGDVEDPDSFVPSHVIGRVEGGSPGATRDVAIAVNGTIAAVSRSFYLATDDEEELVSSMVPPWTLHRGANSVEVLEVLPGGGLRLMGGT